MKEYAVVRFSDGVFVGKRSGEDTYGEIAEFVCADAGKHAMALLSALGATEYEEISMNDYRLDIPVIVPNAAQFKAMESVA